MRKGGRRCGPTFSSWGFWGAVSPQRGPGQSPGGKHILATIYCKLVENQVSGSPTTPLIPIRFKRRSVVVTVLTAIYSHVGLPHIDCFQSHGYEKAAYSSCHGLRYHLEGPCSHYVVLQLGAGARDVLRY